MATYKSVNIPEVNKKYKVVTDLLQFTGKELDKGEGRIVVSFTGREVSTVDDSEKTAANGDFIYDRVSQDNIEANIADELATEIDGITGAQVLNWLAKWVDSKLA